jgi:hypothetical protein
MATSINGISRSIDDDSDVIDADPTAGDVVADPHDGPRCGGDARSNGSDAIGREIDTDRGGSRGAPYCQAIDRCRRVVDRVNAWILRAWRCIEQG